MPGIWFSNDDQEELSRQRGLPKRSCPGRRHKSCEDRGRTFSRTRGKIQVFTICSHCNINPVKANCFHALAIVLWSREFSHVYSTSNGGNADLEVISLGNINNVRGAMRNDVGASLSPQAVVEDPSLTGTAYCLSKLL